MMDVGKGSQRTGRPHNIVHINRDSLLLLSLVVDIVSLIESFDNSSAENPIGKRSLAYKS